MEGENEVMKNRKKEGHHMNAGRIRSVAPVCLMMLALMALVIVPARAEILNDDEFGSLEIADLSVIDAAADVFGPVGLTFNVTRGGPLRPGQEIAIHYHGQHECYVTILDFSPDRIVKPLVMNEQTKLTDGGLNGDYYGTVGEALGKEYVMMIISRLPLTDERIEELALAPNEIELGDEIVTVAVNDFTVVDAGYNANRVVEWGESVNSGNRGDSFIDLEEFATYLGYPLNTYPYDPWPYMYLYPYPRFRPSVYMEKYGPFSKIWYVVPTGTTITSNFWDYATSGWIDNGIWVIPPGGYWQGTFRPDDPYAAYYLRILPYLIRENTSYQRLQVEINGTLVQSSIDITGAIGWGEYWTTNPFAYYNLATLLHTGNNTIRLYWPEDQTENLELQMVDVAPTEVVSSEIEEAATATVTETPEELAADEGGDGESSEDGEGSE